MNYGANHTGAATSVADSAAAAAGGGYPIIAQMPVPTSADPCTTISHFLMKFSVSPEEEFSKKAIDSLIKKLKDKREELDYLIVAVSTRGLSPTKCVNIPRTLDGRLQVAGRKGFPHVVYSRIFRYSDLHKNELKHLPSCETAFDLKCESVCINPYHYERVPQGALASSALLNMPNLNMEGAQMMSSMSGKDKSDHHHGLGNNVQTSTPYGYAYEPNSHQIARGAVGLPGGPSSSHQQQRVLQNSYQDSIKQLLEAPDDIPPDWRSLQQMDTPVVTPQADMSHGMTSSYGNFFDAQGGPMSTMGSYFAPHPYQQMPPLYDPTMMQMAGTPMMHPDDPVLFMNPSEITQMTLMDSSPGPASHASHMMSPPMMTEPQLTPVTDSRALDVLTNAMSSNMSLKNMTPKPKEEPLSPDPGPSGCMTPVPGPSHVRVHREVKRVKSEGVDRPSTSKAHIVKVEGNPFALKVRAAETSAQAQFPELYGRKSRAPTQYNHTSLTRDASQDDDDDANDPLLSEFQRQYSIELEPNVPRISELEDPLSWATIRYHEFDLQVGAPFEAITKEVFIDGGMNPCHQSRFCLGHLANQKRTEVAEKVRENIGKGIRLHVQGEGNVWITNLSDQPVFVHSYHIDKTNEEEKTNNVARVQPLAVALIFDLKDCYDEIRNRDMLQQIGMAYKKNKLTLQRALELAQVTEEQLNRHAASNIDQFRSYGALRVSFIKGWGPDYPRRSVIETPCWVDIQVNRAQQLLDEVLRHPRVDF